MKVVDTVANGDQKKMRRVGGGEESIRSRTQARSTIDEDGQRSCGSCRRLSSSRHNSNQHVDGRTQATSWPTLIADRLMLVSQLNRARANFPTAAQQSRALSLPPSFSDDFIHFQAPSPRPLSWRGYTDSLNLSIVVTLGAGRIKSSSGSSSGSSIVYCIISHALARTDGH